MMKNAVIKTFCIYSFIFIQTAFASEKYAFKVKEYLQKYQLNDSMPLVIIAVHAYDCVNCYYAMSEIINRIEANGNKNIVFLLTGVKPSASKYFFEEKFNFSIDGRKILYDDNFFKSLNADIGSKIFVLEKGEIILDKSPRELDMKDMELLESTTFQISLLDSIQIADTGLDGYVKIHALDRNLVLLHFVRYNMLIKYDIAKKKPVNIIKIKDLQINPDTFLRIGRQLNENKIILYDISNIEFKNKLRFGLSSMFVKDTSIYLGIDISYAFVDSLEPKPYSDKSYCSIVKIPFLIELSKDFELKTAYGFPFFKPIDNKYSIYNGTFLVTPNKELYIGILPITGEDTFNIVGHFKLNPWDISTLIDIPNFSHPSFLPKKVHGNRARYSFDVSYNNDEIFTFFYQWNVLYNLSENSQRKLPEPIFSEEEFNKSITEENNYRINLHKFWYYKNQPLLLANDKNQKTFLFYYSSDYSMVLRKINLFDSDFQSMNVLENNIYGIRESDVGYVLYHYRIN